MKRTRLMQHAGAALAGLALGSGAGAASADVVAVVSARCPTASLTANQVADIFLGKSSRFPDGRPAVPIDQAEGSPARDEFYLKLAGKSPAQLHAHWSRIVFTGRGQPPKEVANSVEVKKHLVGNPDAIGYIERSLVDGSVKAVLSP